MTDRANLDGTLGLGLTASLGSVVPATMTHRERPLPRVLVLILCWLVAVCSACGSRSSDRSPSTTPGTASIEQLLAKPGISPTTALTALCQNWQSTRTESPAINAYVIDLLTPPGNPDNAAAVAPYDTEDIQRAVTAACDQQGKDPAAFVEVVLAQLHIGLGDLIARITDACDRYRVEQNRVATGVWGGVDIDTFVRTIASGKGVTLPQLQQAITAVCN